MQQVRWRWLAGILLGLGYGMLLVHLYRLPEMQFFWGSKPVAWAASHEGCAQQHHNLPSESEVRRMIEQHKRAILNQPEAKRGGGR